MTFQSFSQIETKQDLFVALFYKHKRDGYFVDVGAYDGRHLSNTYQLEKLFGWKGVCIEPLQHGFDGLRAHRACTCVHAAAYSVGGLELEFASSDVLSGIVEHIDRHTSALTEPRIKVRTTTVTEELDKAKAPAHIDYLSVDTEGSELEVLRGIDWDRYSFGLLSIEHNSVEPRRTEMRRFLEARGYSYLRENHWDDDYVRLEPLAPGAQVTRP